MGMADEVWLPGKVDRETEFQGGLHAACGPNAAAMAERWADQSKLGTLDVYHRMRNAGRCDANGASTLSALVADARAAGYTVDSGLTYREPMPEATWRSFFGQHVGQHALVFESGNGQAFIDYLTGKGENARNLKYHFVMVAGWHPGGVSRHPQAKGRTLPLGWWVADGDNFVVGDVLQFYPDAVLKAARPVGAFAVYPRVKIVGGTQEMGVPQGWKDDGKTLTAPNGEPVIKGFRDWVLGHNWDHDDWPLAPERACTSVEPGNPSIGAGTRQDFRMTSLGWTESKDVYKIWAGQDILALMEEVTQLNAKLADQGPSLSPAALKAIAAVKALTDAQAAMGTGGNA